MKNNWFFIILFMFLSIFLQFSLCYKIKLFLGIYPDIPLLYIILLGFYLTPSIFNIIIAFLSGLLIDSLSIALIGPSAISFIFIIILNQNLSKFILKKTYFFQIGLLFICTFIGKNIVFWLSLLANNVPIFQAYINDILPTSLINSFLGLILIPLFTFLFQIKEKSF
ncbi:MAG: rod shape-determining protein MreD [bacterium]